MKSLIFVLIILSFIQSTIVPLDLVLVVLICRGYITRDFGNLYLAFGFGLLIGFLNLIPLGLQSLIYLGLVALTESLSKSRLAGNPILIVPLSFVLLLINQLIISTFLHQSLQLFPKILIEAIVSLPILILLRLWEERFIVKREIKLKI